MPIYHVTLRGEYYGQQTITGWDYVSSGGTPVGGSAADLLEAMGFVLTGTPPAPPSGTVAYELQGLQCAAALWTEVEARNLFSETDFLLLGYNPSEAGAATGVCTSPVLAYGFRSNRVTLSVRRGFKRIVGVTEEAMNVSGTIAGVYLSQLTLFAQRMSDNLTGDSGATYVPTVLHFQAYVTPSGGKAYAPFPTEAEQLTNSAVGVSWQPYDTVRTQRSRQYGHGS